MTVKPDFAAGLKALKQPDPPAPPPPTRSTSEQANRVGKVSIAGYFDLPVRQQLAILAARQNKTQVQLLAEALNLLFEKYGDSPIARG